MSHSDFYLMEERRPLLTWTVRLSGESCAHHVEEYLVYSVVLTVGSSVIAKTENLL